MELYEEQGIDKSRILIKLASTWEGIRAAEELEKEGHPLQPDAAVLLRPGARLCRSRRVPDLAVCRPHLRLVQQAKQPMDPYVVDEDPGVKSVRNIYDYYKQHRYETIVMGASFRRTEQILALAGCDRLTISPNLLKELQDKEETVIRKLVPPPPFCQNRKP